jgi:hypothetical protein
MRKDGGTVDNEAEMIIPDGMMDPFVVGRCRKKGSL